jgi:adaptin ear-binding coat-associated protein 1/2
LIIIIIYKGELFAACPVDAYPSAAVESVSDSARYFVLRIKDDQGRSAFIGVGFTDRSDSFDFNVALQDHFKYLKKDEELLKNPSAAMLDNEKKLDLSFKEGQTIKINIGVSFAERLGGKELFLKRRL